MATVEINTLSPAVSMPVAGVPQLCAGDRLTRAEFERRYAAMPDVKKAELIEGKVYMPSPVSRKHGNPQFYLVTWLGMYSISTPGIEGGDNTTVRLDWDNEPQPDAFLRIAPQLGGQSRDDGEYVGGAPELIAEIAVSSESYDLHDKFHAYQRNGVQEYIVWRVREAAIDWFALREGQFKPLPSTDAGQYQSEVFPGLWLDPAALLRGDFSQVAAVLQSGLASPEHANFIAKLHAAAGRTGA